MTLLLGIPGGAVPPPVPPPAVPPRLGPDRSGLLHVYVGWDGSVWELSRHRSGVRLLSGVEGLDTVQHQRFAVNPPQAAGSRTTTTRTLERTPSWPIAIYQGGGSQAWYDYAASFLRALDPDRNGTWYVTQPNGITRSLSVKLLEVPEPAHTTDPGQIGWGRFTIRLVADQPYWEGARVERTFANKPPIPVFGGPGVLGISAGSSLDRAEISNPGDVEAWPVYDIVGPTETVSAGLDGRRVTFPVAVPDGQVVTITTGPGPRGKSAYDSLGRRRTAELTSRQFAPVPPGQSVPLELAMTGSGSVTVSLVPLHRRAYGA